MPSRHWQAQGVPVACRKKRPNMAFKIFNPTDPQDGEDAAVTISPPLRSPPANQLALRLNARPVGVAPVKPPGRGSSHAIQAHITHLASQIDALRQQLREHSTDRIALLLGEMIAEREQELARWMQRENAWDQRLAVIEGAINERDAFRRREAELVRERDEARQALAAAAAAHDMAQRAAEAARREAAQVRRVADQATAEQLRLRAERELDERANARRALSNAARQNPDRGWIKRLIGR